MSAIKLTYFDTPGRAEPARIAFYIGGVEFEDERLSNEQFQEMKASGKFTFGSLPVITIDGEVYAQSYGIGRYAGRLSGLYPEDPLEALRVDEIGYVNEDIFQALMKDTSVEGRKICLKEDMPRYLGAMNKIYGKTKGPFLLNDKMSMADLQTYVMIPFLVSGRVKHFPTELDQLVGNYGNIKKMLEAVAENKKVAEWEKQHQNPEREKALKLLQF